MITPKFLIAMITPEFLIAMITQLVRFSRYRFLAVEMKTILGRYDSSPITDFKCPTNIHGILIMHVYQCTLKTFISM